MSKHDEKITRRSRQDIVDIGLAVEKFYNGLGGVVFRAIVNQIINEAISDERDTLTSAERRLGRAEGANKVRDYLEMAISDKDKMLEPIKQDEDLEEGR